MSHRITASVFVRLAMIVALVATLGLQLFASSGTQAQSGSQPQVYYLFGSGSTHGGRIITLRVELTGPAPSGGALVRMRSERPDVIPVEDVTVPAGETEVTFQVDTNPVISDTYIRVTAGYGGRTVGREVQILEPRLRALYLQTVTRGGGEGKMTVCLDGPAPPEGIMVRTTSDNPAAYMVPATVTIAPGDGCTSLAVPAGEVEEDTLVWVTAAYQGVSRMRDTIVRNFGDPGTATATATTDPLATATNTAVAATATNTAEPTATSTEVLPTATASATVDPAAPDFSYEIQGTDTQPVEPGETLVVRVTLVSGTPPGLVNFITSSTTRASVAPTTFTFTTTGDFIDLTLTAVPTTQGSGLVSIIVRNTANVEIDRSPGYQFTGAPATATNTPEATETPLP